MSDATTGGGGLLLALTVMLAVALWPTRRGTDGGWAALTGGSVEPGSGAEATRSAADPAGGSAGGSAGGPTAGARRHWWRRGRRAEQDGADLLAVLDQVATALRAGVSPVTALAALSRAGSVPPRMGDLVHDLLACAQAGEPLGPVWRSWSERRPGAGLNLLAQAWLVSEQTGAPLAESVSSAVRMVRAERDQRRLVAATLAQARATMSVLTALPLGGPLLGLAVGVDPASVLASPVPTVMALTAGAALLAVGRLWVRRQVAGVVRGPVVT